MRDLTVAATIVRALMEFAVSMGGSPELLAERSCIDPAELQDGDNRIPLAKYVALMRAGQELCGDPALALHFGASVNVAELSLACMIGAFSETMTESFSELNRYARLASDVCEVADSDRFQLVHDGGDVWI